MNPVLDETTPEPDRIVIENYDPQWAVDFAREAAALKKIPCFSAAEFQHVGSTGVPGLASKSIIDILIAVPDCKSSDYYQEILHPGGYEYRDVKDSGRHFFERYTGQRFHLHITEKDSWHYWRLISFRDRLVRDAKAAAQYVSLKKELAAHHGADRAAYSNAKTDFVSRVTLEELSRYPELEERFIARATALRKSLTPAA